jgi:hypothetical protein
MITLIFCFNNQKNKNIIPIPRNIRWILFIISGLIKLNDPIGFSHKPAEYFSEPVLTSRFLCPACLVISAFFGYCWSSFRVMLLIGYKAQFTIWSLLLMIVFFYFLNVLFCFRGKGLRLFWDTPLILRLGFTKDIVLLVLLFLSFFQQKTNSTCFLKNQFKTY